MRNKNRPKNIIITELYPWGGGVKLSKDKHFSKFLAFTLAEVLIVLGIIGIIAEMTIPTLMQGVKNREFISKMQKEYSVLSQAYSQLESDNGGNIVYALSDANSHAGLKNVFKTKLSYVKECDDNGYKTASNYGVCFPKQVESKFLNGKFMPAGWSFYFNTNVPAGLVLADGASLAFWLDSNTCQSSLIAGHNDRCGYVIVDVNGLQKPNTWGKDIYLFFIFSDRIRPSGPSMNDLSPNDDCGVGTNLGYDCATKYLSGFTIQK